MLNYGGIVWNSDTRVYDISGANLQINEHITFKNNNHQFNGKYSSLRNKPNLGIKYAYSDNDSHIGVAVGEIRFDNANLLLAEKFSINKTDADGVDNLSDIEEFNSSSNTLKGKISIFDEELSANGMTFSISSMDDDIVAGQLYRTFNITKIR